MVSNAFCISGDVKIRGDTDMAILSPSILAADFARLGEQVEKYYQDNNEDALIMWTENIFWDKFKVKFLENEKELNSRINIL